MPFIGLLKGKNQNYLFTDNCYYPDETVMEMTSPRQFRIQKFKNFILGYDGDIKYFQKLIEHFDFDSFPEPLTDEFIIKNFYLDFLDFLVEECPCDINNGYLNSSKFQIFIIGKNYAYNICDEYPYNLNQHGFLAGGNDEIAFKIHDYFKESKNEKEIIDLMMKKTTEHTVDVRYPFIMVESSDLNHVQFIYKDGKTEKKKLQKLSWGSK